MNSEAFSHFSLPSNNLIHGLRAGVGLNQTNTVRTNEGGNMLQESMSSEFSSAIRSQPTVNNQMVNLGAPSSAAGAVPMQMCQSNYENNMASSYYQTEESFQSAEQNAFNQEQMSKQKRQDKELKLQEF